MISAFINICNELPSIGHYFLAFLQFYGWNYVNKHTIVMEGEYMLYVKENAIEELVIADLFKPGVNAAAGVTKFKEIQELLRKTYEEVIQGDMGEITWKKVK